MSDDLQAPGTTSPEEAANPPEPDTPVAKTTRKSAAKKTTAKKATAKKATAIKATAKRTATKKAATPADSETDSGTDSETEPQVGAADESPADAAEPAKKTTVKKAAAKKATTKKAAAKKAAEKSSDETADETAEKAPAKRTAAKTAKKTTTSTRTRKTAVAKAAAAEEPTLEDQAENQAEDQATLPLDPAVAQPVQPEPDSAAESSEAAAPMPLFQPPAPVKKTTRRTRKVAAPEPVEEPEVQPEPADQAAEAEEDVAAVDETTEQGSDQAGETAEAGETTGETTGDSESDSESDSEGGSEGGGGRRRRRRGGRRRRKSGGADSGDSAESGEPAEGDSTEHQDSKRDGNRGGQGNQRAKGAKGGSEKDAKDSKDGSDAVGTTGEASGDKASREDAGESGESGESGGGESSSSRRRRRRRRSGDDAGDATDDPQNTVTRVRKQRSAEDEITAVSGSTRLEAKKQRRREGREAGRRRAPIVSEAEFLARRESVDRVMVVRQREELTQIGVLEDKVLVEHYVARESQTSLIGNVYLGRVQNVLPSMEAAFIDIGKGRNAVLYAGEVNWSALGHKEGQPRKIESVLSSGQPVLVQVTKDPIGHKGARLTSQISLAGRFLVYVPDGTTSGISRKLPDTERARLKALLKEIVPDSAGVIVRTAAEGASEDELTRDVERLKARWEDIEKQSRSGSAPKLLYGEPDLTLKVVRDLFTEDFSRLVIQGDDAWDTVQGYVAHVAPDLEDRLERYDDADGKDVFAAHRIDEQIAKGLDRKVWLPSGGSLIIDRTEAMTVVDVNTGKFTGSGGNLEETVTKNNLEAAEEIVRQLRLRDIGGIIVVDFIDMVLESNRDLVLRRLVECLGRDRTRHQVAEVTSLGLVQMTRKRIGTGLLEAFSENCEHCNGRGLITRDTPVEPKRSEDDSRRGGGRRSRGGRGRGEDRDHGGSGSSGSSGSSGGSVPSPKEVAAMAKPENAEKAAAAQAEEVAAAPQAPAEPDAKPDAKPEARPEARPEPARAEVPAAKAPVSSEPADTPGTPETPETPASPTGPRVTTTRTQRRSVTVVTPRTPAPAPIVPAAQPAARPAAPVDDAEPAAAVAAEPPRVVTTTRRRTASRPAGPPSGATTETRDGAGDAGGDEHEHVEHVPVKKKGTRKR